MIHQGDSRRSRTVPTERSLRVGIDARCLNRPHMRGMGKYLSSMVAYVDRLASVEWRLFGDRPDLPTHPPACRSCDFELFETPGYRFRCWEQVGLPHRTKRFHVDVLHSTATTLPWWQPVPTVVTIHDVIPWLEDGGESQPSWYQNRLVPSAYHKCAAVITISNNSRDDILELWPRLADKLHVIPHGIDGHYLQPVEEALSPGLQQQGVRAPYLLYLGGEVPRKRLDWALRVFQRLSEPDLQLVICGIDAERQAGVLETVSSEVRSAVCFAPFVPEQAMPALYGHACAVLYPTLYEGFGLPVIESHAVGTPILFSSVGSLTELEGPAASVLPVEDLESWVSTCRSLVALRRQSPQPNEKARHWASRFSWEESARKHLEVYRLAVASRSGR